MRVVIVDLDGYKQSYCILGMLILCGKKFDNATPFSVSVHLVISNLGCEGGIDYNFSLTWQEGASYITTFIMLYALNTLLFELSSKNGIATFIFK